MFWISGELSLLLWCRFHRETHGKPGSNLGNGDALVSSNTSECRAGRAWETTNPATSAVSAVSAVSAAGGAAAGAAAGAWRLGLWSKTWLLGPVMKPFIANLEKHCLLANASHDQGCSTPMIQHSDGGGCVWLRSFNCT